MSEARQSRVHPLEPRATPPMDGQTASETGLDVRTVNMGRLSFCVPPRPERTLMREMMMSGAMTRSTSKESGVTCTLPAHLSPRMTTEVKRNWEAARKEKEGNW